MGNSGSKSQPTTTTNTSDQQKDKNEMKVHENLSNVKKEGITSSSPPQHHQNSSAPLTSTPPTTNPQPEIVAPVHPTNPIVLPTSQEHPQKSQNEPVVDSHSASFPMNQSDVVNDSVQDFDPPSSISELPRQDSIEQNNFSEYQDRKSDLTLEETDQENVFETLIDCNDQMKSSSCNMSSEELQKRQNEENNALDYIREVCSPTVSFSLQSDQWAHRKEGLELIQKYIERNTGTVKKMTEEQCNHEFLWICIILRKYFLDRVAPVYYAAYDCFRALLKVYASYVHGHEIEAMLRSLIHPLLQNLGGESTGTNKRTQKEACRCILRIARLTSIDGLGLILIMLQEKEEVGNQQDTTPTPTSGIIGIKQKLSLLKILINEFSISESSNGNYDSGISSDLVLSICQIGINHSDDKIRKLAVEIMGMTYQRVGKNIKMYIIDVKPAMLKVLEKKFSEIDAMNGSTTSVSNNTPSSSFSSSSSSLLFNETNSESTNNKIKSKKVENIRNLAPVVIKSSGGSKSRLLSSTMNSSFSGTAMISTNPDGEENFVVMKNPTPLGSSSSFSSSSTTTTTTPQREVKSQKLPSTLGTTSAVDSNKENSLNSLKSPLKPPRSNTTLSSSMPGMNGNNSSKNRFEISDDQNIATSPSTSSMMNKKEKKGTNHQLKPQQTNKLEDNRFYIDETLF